MIKNIIWDFDGTLFDTYPAIARGYQLALSDFGYDLPIELFYSLTRVSMDYCIEQITQRFDVEEDAYIAHFREHYGAMTSESSPPFPCALHLCKEIIALGGKNFLVTHRRRASATELLKHYSAEKLFTGSLFGDDGFAWKPNPDMFNHIIEKFELIREETLAVGDRSLDIEAGKAANIRTGLYVNLEEDLKRSDSIIFSFSELTDLLKN